MHGHVLLAFLFVGVIAILAAPIEVSEEANYGDYTNDGDNDFDSLFNKALEEVAQEIANTRADRQRRVTCDLLSFKGIAEHSACAANCLSMGKAGGRCENGICLCRTTTFMDLWNKRFG
ncbi:defensin 1 [Andrena cerasifolii]|uniref:defensin 1 n=1 Tax=Andrena cerasifolii TaxID=2819439 RepID=UPI004037BF7E